MNEWLQENTFNKIAKYNGIGAGTVTSIHQAARISDISDGDMMRELALMLKKKVLLVKFSCYAYMDLQKGTLIYL